jgi:hypothetical protein
MNQQRQCPMCGRLHEVADDGTIQTWNVRWSGDEAPQFGPDTYASRTSLSPERATRLEELRKKHPGRGQQQEQREQRVTDIPGYISNRDENFIHHEDALSEYNWIKGILQRRGDWIRMQEFLVLEEGDRASWYELFESPDTNWMA